MPCFEAHRDAVGAPAAQVHERRGALDAHVRATQDLREARRAVRDEPHRVAGRYPVAHLLREQLDAAVEVLRGARLEHERVERARHPRQLAGLDAAGDDEHAPHPQPLRVTREARIRRDHVREQRFADLVVAHVQFAGVDAGHERLRTARALFVEAVLDGVEHPRLFEYHERLAVQVVEDRRLFVVGQTEPRFGNIGAAGEIRAQR